MEEKLEEYIPREYQLQLLEDIKKANTILYLPTGSGKTYIAMMLIKEIGESLNKPLGQGRKWTFFVVQSIPLVGQQANYLRKHLPWSIGTFTGDMNVDFWSQEQWLQILNKCHILVMTAQIYLNNLLHGYMNIKDANLIIFDECHHAVSLHPFRQIMQVVHDTNFINDDKSPHILGMTAILINSNSKNVEDDLAKLQQTFNATIKTRYGDDIQIFAAHPEEHVHSYSEHILDKELQYVCERIKSIIERLKDFKSPDKNEPITDNKNIFHLEHTKSLSKSFSNYFLDIEVHLIESGVYAAFLATWHFLIEIEKKQKLHSDSTKSFLISIVFSEIIVLRKILYDYMKKVDTNVEGLNSLKYNISPKLRELMNILSNIKCTDSCLIFVDRRTTAKILYHYIKDFITEHKQEHIKCNFVVGSKGIFSFESNELLYKKKQNDIVIKSFNDGHINVLITSEVLEEGVDIQSCNYVIRYDSPKNFPSYVQSKGRARSNDSKFIVLVPDILKFKKVQAEYTKMENEINKVLIHTAVDENTEDMLVEVFKTKLAVLTHDIAISIINRYCSSLPQDRFTQLSPEWYMGEDYNNLKKYKLKLPINSVLKTPVDGIFCNNKKNAKKSAAFNACIKLYELGALDDNLLPISIINNSVYSNLNWFPHWVEKDIEACKLQCKPGTNKMKRIVHIENPSYLYGAYPKMVKPSYLHVIDCTPKYNELIKNSKYETFDKLLKSNKHFGILTSKKLPSVSKFPIFLNSGDVNVHIKVNVDLIFLDQEHHKKLENFHSKLFLDVLGVKEFVIRSFNNVDDSYLIIPIYSSGNIYNINWDLTEINAFVETEVPTTEQKQSNFYKDYLKTPNIISPWYRNVEPVERYIVTDVHYDMTPDSPFPTSEFDTYETYFRDKYSIHVVNKNQPLIKVKSLGVSKINFLIPRIFCDKKDNRKEYIEIFIPEFCVWHKFPSVYWFKALMLPTILYRFNRLLLAENLLVKINSMCNIKVQYNLNEDTVKIDDFCGFHKIKNKNIILPISETLKYVENSHIDVAHDWELNNTIIDIERQKNVTMLDVLNYYTSIYTVPQSTNYKNADKQFIDAFKDQDSTNSDSNNSDSNKLTEEILSNVFCNMNPLNVYSGEPPILSPLSKLYSDCITGPTQSDILKVITPPKANDMFSYERMETYGDSFIKFACSLVLFDAFKLENEGVLTQLKGKMIGNRNLFYVGRRLNIGSYLLVNSFEPVMDWIPPCFVVPQKIKEIIEKCNLSSDVLYQIMIPRNDKFSGILSDETWVKIETELVQFKKLCEMPMSDSDGDGGPKESHSQSDIFIHKQLVSDKTVADCVEALIGTYVYRCGVEVGFKVLHGLDIIPEEFITAYKPNENLCFKTFPTIDFSHILPGYEILEQRIDYTFKNKYLLVQALTHPSYQSGYSECYQRLEFLGDAILDFLITTYIIEHCNNKTPGEITDIRSSLVNNITFASLSIRIGLHRFILAKSVKLTEAIEQFYVHQQKNNHKIGQEVLYLIEEGNCHAAESIDVPKVLGDLFESLIAAIYLDCNRDLRFVWKICYRYLENEIKEFCTNIPKNPIRILHETKLQPIFSKPVTSAKSVSKGLGYMIQLDIILNKKNMTLFGFGQNKKEAKVAAAKMALKHMKELL